jgi:hypothetical protein
VAQVNWAAATVPGRVNSAAVREAVEALFKASVAAAAQRAAPASAAAPAGQALAAGLLEVVVAEEVPEAVAEVEGGADS